MVDVHVILDQVKAEFDRLERRLSEEVPSIQKLEDYDVSQWDLMKYRWCYVSNEGRYVPSTYSGDRNSPNLNSTVERVEKRRDSLVSILNGIKETLSNGETRKRNLEIIENNQRVVSVVKEFMSGVGIPERVSVQVKSRARNPKYQTVSSGYVQDLLKHVTLRDGKFDQVVARIDATIKEVETWAKNLIVSLKETKKLEETRLQEEAGRRLLAKMQVKYDLSHEADWNEVLDALTSRDKYLRLGHYLCKNRDDWNDGPYWASVGLDAFKVETDLDKKIEEELSRLIHDWDGDGRVFRDCEYSYSHLFSLADLDLYGDYQEIISYLD